MSRLNEVAYTDKKHYLERSGWERTEMFVMAGLSGVVTQGYFVGAEGELGDYTRIGLGAGTYAAEWSVTSWIKQRLYARENDYPMGGFYTGNSSRAKVWLMLDKWRASSRDILLGQ